MEITFKTVQRTVNRFKGKTASLDSRLSDREIFRMVRTASMIPIAKENKTLLVDVGGSIFWVPIYMELLGYKKVIILNRPGGGQTLEFNKDEIDIGKDFNFEILECDAELSKYPIDSGQASCVVCFELLEHFAGDPMNCISESNRILRDNGNFLLTTPNVIKKENLAKIAFGRHPSGWSVFTDSFSDRHNREYTPFEVKKLLEGGGFEINLLQTFTNRNNQSLRLKSFLLRLFGTLLSLPAFLTGLVPLGMREGHILVRAKKIGPVLHRYPGFMYEMFGANKVNFKIPLNLINEQLKEENHLCCGHRIVDK